MFARRLSARSAAFESVNGVVLSTRSKLATRDTPRVATWTQTSAAEHPRSSPRHAARRSSISSRETHGRVTRSTCRRRRAGRSIRSGSGRRRPLDTDATIYSPTHRTPHASRVLLCVKDCVQPSARDRASVGTPRLNDVEATFASSEGRVVLDDSQLDPPTTSPVDLGTGRHHDRLTSGLLTSRLLTLRTMDIAVQWMRLDKDQSRSAVGRGQPPSSRERGSLSSSSAARGEDVR